MERAPAPLEPLPVVDVGGELVGHPLVGDQHRRAVGAHRTHRTQDADRIDHVVDGLECADEVERAGQLRIGGIAHFEGGPVGHASFGRVDAGLLDGRMSRSKPVTVAFGNPRAIEIDDHPVPHPISATRADGSAPNRSTSPGTRGNHSDASRLTNMGRLILEMKWRVSAP